MNRSRTPGACSARRSHEGRQWTTRATLRVHCGDDCSALSEPWLLLRNYAPASSSAGSRLSRAVVVNGIRAIVLHDSQTYEFSSTTQLRRTLTHTHSANWPSEG